MEDKSWTQDHNRPRSWIDAEMENLAQPSLLIVEDDDDIRDMLVMLLGMSGFQVVACCTAEEALEHLRESPFDLVLTDYCLPHRSGGWLLKQAEAEGLLDATPALVITAHPNPADTQGFEIIPKPFDLEELVERVRRRLTGDSEPRRKPRTGTIQSSPRKNGDGEDDDQCPDPIELILYVSSQSPKSVTAIENIKAVLSTFESARVKLTICDLSLNPSAGNVDSIAFTPTLVKRSPGPRTFILGHLSSPALVLELLKGCVEP
jgi:DNA-binding response OmpR family regulator